MQEWLEDRPQTAGFCDGCGAAITEAARFCTACGRPQREFCSWCGAELANTSLFCVSCGRPAVRERAKIYPRGAVAGKPIAGFAFRAGVYLVDGLMWSTLTQNVGSAILRGTTADLDAIDQRLPEDEITSFAELMDAMEPVLWWIGLVFVVGVVLQVVWNSIGWSPAQRVIGLRIVDATGNAPGWRRGLGRTAASWLSSIAIGLGYLAAAWHPEKRTWHDRMAGTWVVDVRTDR